MTKTVIVCDGIDIVTLFLTHIPRQNEPLIINGSDYIIEKVTNGIDKQSLTVVLQVIEL